KKKQQQQQQQQQGQQQKGQQQMLTAYPTTTELSRPPHTRKVTGSIPVQTIFFSCKKREM
ncbi:hypothetical protein M1146_07710, partial [Patescibacteria group bacterium]|nr:hypothetical protein [Patescibacteria group bacterium]